MTNYSDHSTFSQGLSASSTMFTNLSFPQLGSYSGAASFAGYSTTGVAAIRQLTAVPTLTELTNVVKTLIHDLMASKA